MKAMGSFCSDLYHFLVDSPLLAVLALVALAVAALVAALGTPAAAGWLLFVLVVLALGVDLSRAARPKRPG
jgi:hypothetical protein